jgi:hypothetical protein
MPASSSRSAGCRRRPLPDRISANATTSALPRAANSQKPVEGRCRCSSAPTSAVASGSTPTITLACTASTWRIATEVKSGKPNTTPADVSMRGHHSSRRGRGARVATRNTADSAAATTARPSATKTPAISGASGVPTARRVMGKVSAKIATPRNPSHRPLRSAGVIRSPSRRRCRPAPAPASVNQSSLRPSASHWRSSEPISA